MINDLFFFERESTFSCRCGKTHHIPVRRTLLGNDVLKRIPSVLHELVSPTKILLVADENTYAACGEKVERILVGHRFKTITACLKKQDRFAFLEPDEEARSQLGQFLHQDPDLILAVGSGVINDLVKFVSHRIGIPYAVVATAPSMDGYPSPGAPMLVGGYKETLPASPPQAIFMDLAILCAAPLELIQSGFADLIGKITANADWELRRYLLGEDVCEYTWELVEGALNLLEEKAEAIGRRDPDAVYALAVALLNSGFSMVITGDSRPASGAEHLIAHYLEIMSLQQDRHPSLHGLRVGAATILVKRMFDHFLRHLPDFDWEKLMTGTIKKESFDEVMLHFGPLFPFVEQEAREKVTGGLRLARLPNPATIEEMRRSVEKTLAPVPDPKKTLKRCGAPVTFQELGFPETLLRNACRFSRYVRGRITLLDLLAQADLLDEYLVEALAR
ncbi:MAG TPA: sn-glycerol-1-phosphate dehydrogenase [Atribacteraceae bacterium]|nr:sn-glycerol-1-phosphate dehydrogenase [Atribacteraceae bacterium]